MSSFYLEMRTAEYALSNAPLIYLYDIANLLRHLREISLRDMNDPSLYPGARITAGIPAGQTDTVFGRLDVAIQFADLAIRFDKLDIHDDAVGCLKSIFERD
jgi:hypothetical protein